MLMIQHAINQAPQPVDAVKWFQGTDAIMGALEMGHFERQSTFYSITRQFTPEYRSSLSADLEAFLGAQKPGWNSKRCLYNRMASTLQYMKTLNRLAR